MTIAISPESDILLAALLEERAQKRSTGHLCTATRGAPAAFDRDIDQDSLS